MTSLIISLLLCLSFGVQADQGTLAIYGKVNGAPKHYQGEDGQGTGYAIDIARAAVERAGFMPKVVNRPWQRAQLEALEGKGVITAFSRTPEREKIYLFSEPLYADQVLLVMHADQAREFSSFADLKDRVIGMSRGSRYGGEFFNYQNEMEIVEDDNQIQRMLKLTYGRIDAAIFSGGEYGVKHNAKRAGVDPAILYIAPTPIAEEFNYIGIPKSLTGYDPRDVKLSIDRALYELRAEGVIDMILSEYR